MSHESMSEPRNCFYFFTSRFSSEFIVHCPQTGPSRMLDMAVSLEYKEGLNCIQIFFQTAIPQEHVGRDTSKTQRDIADIRSSSAAIVWMLVISNSGKRTFSE